MSQTRSNKSDLSNEVARWIGSYGHLPILGISVVIAFALGTRGWWPFDDGMLGHSAERVMSGEIPHIDFDDPYTGGQAVLHAAIFQTFGIDIVNLRYLLIASFCLWGVAAWAILRRWVERLTAAIVTASAGVGSLLAWPTPLPSWYTTIATTYAAWMTLRWLESGRLRYLFYAGTAIGVGSLFKLTALYGLGAIITLIGMSIRRSPSLRINTMATLLIVGPPTAAILVVAQDLNASTASYFLLPLFAAVALAVKGRSKVDGTTVRGAGSIEVAAVIGGMLLVVLSWAVLLYGPHHFQDAYNGWLVQPQRRVAFVNTGPPAIGFTIGVVLVGLAGLRFASRVGHGLPKVGVAIGTVVAVVVTAGWVRTYMAAEMAAGFVTLVILIAAISWQHLTDRALFLVLVAAYAALVAFPHYSPTYVAYVGPLIAIGLVVALAEWQMKDIATQAVALFAGASIAMVAIGGYSHGGIFPPSFTTNAIPRVSLPTQISLSYYEDIMTTVQAHAAQQPIWAGPDLSHIYFLTQLESVTRHIYEFSDEDPYFGLIERLHDNCVRVIVMNVDHARVSDLPPTEILGELRSIYERVELISGHEIRWTESARTC